MSIDKVEVMNSQGNLLNLSLEDISNGYIVKEITGLDPVKSTIVSSNFANMDGQQYQASSREIRNVTIRLGYAPNFSVNETIPILRSRLYQFFMPESEITLAFYMLDGLVVHITGRVESCEAPLFTKAPEMNISILCFDPDFVDLNTVEIHDRFSTTDTTPKSIDVSGSIKTGISSLRFTATESLGEFTIYHTPPSGILYTMLISAPLILGDVVDICTIKGKKSITLTRDSVTSSLLWAVSPQSTWILLEPGSNQFYMNASTTDPSPVFVDFNNRYGGL